LKTGRLSADNNGMDSLLPLLALTVISGIGMALVMMVRDRPPRSPSQKRGLRKRSKDRNSLVRQATRRLSRDPHDQTALQELGDVYFQEKNWRETYKIFARLQEAGGGERDRAFDNNLRRGLSALRTGHAGEAYQALQAAYAIKQDDFDLCYNLGIMEFQRENFPRAVQILSQARRIKPDHPPTLRALGNACFRIKKHHEAMTFIKRALELVPGDKESLYILGDCYCETGQNDQALRVFGLLRNDPVIGPAACLISGTIHANARRFDRAIENFEIGLKHLNIRGEVKTDLRYRLAVILIKQNEISRALIHLRDIRRETPGYKDVEALISHYKEINASHNLQTYLLAPQEEFTALCRRIAAACFPRAKMKIGETGLHANEWIDILAEVDTAKWHELIMFRFIRTQGVVGELVVRDFHSHIREVKAGRGICLAPGVFSDGARQYTEARLIDLIGKERFLSILNGLDGA